MNSDSKVRLISFYLPQFHPIPENDEWWGKGFTEWTNVGKAKPLFPGHYQPKVPADLGYYDLRLAEVREQQAILAKEAGIEGFCYWHYWYEGKRLLERPFNEVLTSNQPDFPFCLFWANHSWYAKNWNKDVKDKLLIEQTYGDEADYVNHFFDVLPAFKDSRYIKVDGKPIFGIYSYKNFPKVSEFIQKWQSLALSNGLPGIHFLTISYKSKEQNSVFSLGFDAIVFDLAFLRKTTSRYFLLFLHKVFKIPQIIHYRDYAKALVNHMPIEDKIYPCVIPNFDHTPRSGRRGSVMVNSTPKEWYRLLTNLFSKIKGKEPSRNLVFVKSWNEWAEGNYMEPDLRYGRGYINALRDALGKLE